MPDSISSELKRLGICSTITNIKSLSGGCISQAACYSTDKGNFFVKVKAKKKNEEVITSNNRLNT